MKFTLHIFFTVILLTTTSTLLLGQELQLSISEESKISDILQKKLAFKTQHTNYKSLEEEILNFTTKLQNAGYIESRNIATIKKNDSLYITTYYLGNKYNFISIDIKETSFTKQQLLSVSKIIENTAITIPIEEVPAAISKLNNYQIQEGNSFAKLKLENIRVDNNMLKATLISTLNTQRKIDSLNIKGYEKFPKSFLKYFAGIKKGNIFNKKKLIEQNESLNSLGFVTTIKPPEALFRKDKTVVYFYLEKQNYNNFDGILGFATNETTQQLEFNGYLNLELNNNLNFGEQFLLNYKADGNDQRNFRVKAVLPYISKTPLGTELELKIFRRDSTFSSTNSYIKATYQINPQSSTFLGYENFNSSNLLTETLTTDNISNINGAYLTGGIKFIKVQNNRLFPVKTNLAIEGAYGNRAAANVDETQVKISTLANHIFKLNSTNQIYIQNSTSALFSNSYFTNELFRFGGINSIRGFTENSIDASIFTVLNTEYRFLLNESSYIHSIIDLGYFENEIISQKEKLYSFGIGLGVLTRAGILKMNIANGNIDNQDFKFMNTKIHLSLTTRF